MAQGRIKTSLLEFKGQEGIEKKKNKGPGTAQAITSTSMGEGKGARELTAKSAGR